MPVLDSELNSILNQANTASQYDNAVRLADMLGMPRPVTPSNPSLDQQGQGGGGPKTTAGKIRVKRGKKVLSPNQLKKRMAKKQAEVDKISDSLFSKLLVGNAAVRGDVSGGDIVAFSEIPRQVRDSTYLPAPPVGWDVTKLNKQEKTLLMRLRAQGQKERANLAMAMAPPNQAI